MFKLFSSSTMIIYKITPFDSFVCTTVVISTDAVFIMLNNRGPGLKICNWYDCWEISFRYYHIVSNFVSVQNLATRRTALADMRMRNEHCCDSQYTSSLWNFIDMSWKYKIPHILNTDRCFLSRFEVTNRCDYIILLHQDCLKVVR